VRPDACSVRRRRGLRPEAAARCRPRLRHSRIETRQECRPARPERTGGAKDSWMASIKAPSGQFTAKYNIREIFAQRQKDAPPQGKGRRNSGKKAAKPLNREGGFDIMSRSGTVC